MWGLTTVVAAAALAIVAMSFAVAGGAVIVAVPRALLAVGLAFVAEVKRKRTQSQLIHRHREDAKTDKVDFTARDRQTLSTD